MRLLNPLFIIALLLGSASCNSKEAPPPRQESVPVTAAAVEKRDMPVEVRAVGNVEASLSVSIVAQVGGVLDAIHFTEGASVKKGDRLFSIDPRPLQAAVKERDAALARARSEAANAQSTLERYETLVKKEFITKEQFDQARTAAVSLNANVAAAQAALDTARVEVSYADIRSPIDGRTGIIFVKPGNVVRATADTALVTIQQLKPVHVRFSVPEQFLTEIRKPDSGALAVRVQGRGAGVAEVSGTLTFVDNTVDRATGTVVLKATFPNSDEALWPGQFVEVVLVLTTRKAALVVPAEAVQTAQDRRIIWVIKPDMSVEQRTVVPAFTASGYTVIETGVSEGEQVVVDGQLRLSTKSKVTIKTPEPAKK